MKIWAADIEGDALGGVMANAHLSKKIAACGSDIIAVREALRAAREELVEMQLARPTANTVEKKRQSIPDLVTWSWMVIFSWRAASTAIKYGCEEGEFWPCRFNTNPEEEFFFHLPIKIFDIVDVDRSTFKHFLPLTPPVPMFIDTLVTKQLPDHLPPCFRAPIPGRSIVFSELLLRDDFKVAWDRNAFRGATFRLLSI